MPKVVSLFSGAGGLDLGLENAGFDITLCLDNDPVAVATLKQNQAALIPRPDGRAYLSHTRVLQGDVTKLTESGLRQHLSHDEVDLLVGGPPCQPFSSAGKLGSFTDPRGMLFRHFVRIAAELRPHHILFENVRGLATARGHAGTPGSALTEVLEEFERVGYFTNVALLNAADYGAFQRRVRLFMLMSYGATPADFPCRTHYDPKRQNGNPWLSEDLAGVAPWRTLGEFLASREPPSPDAVVAPSARLARLLRDVPPGSGLKSPGTVETTRPGGHWGYKQGTFIADSARPARTITAASTQDWIRLPDGSLRRLTLGECQALQGFPAAWEFFGPQAAKFRQVGNAVPPLFGELLGKSITDHWARREAGFPCEAEASSRHLPADIMEAIRYTEKEERRNGEARRLKLAKGLGSESASR